MKLCWSSNWVERVEANAFCSGGRDRTAAAQLDKWELQGCANVNSSFSSNIFCQFLDGSPSDVIGCSPERRYDHRSMGRKWIGGNIFPSSFQIGQAGEAPNVDIGWKRQNNKKTCQCFFFPFIPVSNVAVSLIIDLYDIISFGQCYYHWSLPNMIYHKFQAIFTSL